MSKDDIQAPQPSPKMLEGQRTCLSGGGWAWESRQNVGRLRVSLLAKLDRTPNHEQKSAHFLVYCWGCGNRKCLLNVSTTTKLTHTEFLAQRLT